MIKTAGMVQGTPDWQLDRAYETETAEMLEAAYQDDQFPFYSIESSFSEARYYIGQAVEHLSRAAEEAAEYGEADPIDALIEKLDDDFRSEMSAVLRKLKERR